MKYFLAVTIIFLLTLNSCKEKQSGNSSVYEHDLSDKNKTSEKTVSSLETDSLEFSETTNYPKLIKDELIGVKLVGMQISDNSEEDVYKKYGLDISSLCYASNLGTIRVNENSITISNYYEFPEDNTNLVIDSMILTNNSMEVIMKKEKPLALIICKVENAPIYSLEIKGEINTNLYINKFFTSEQELTKFSIHDCGDFDG